MTKYNATLEEFNAIKAATDAAIMALRSVATIDDLKLVSDLRDYFTNIASILTAVVEAKREKAP